MLMDVKDTYAALSGAAGNNASALPFANAIIVKDTAANILTNYASFSDLNGSTEGTLGVSEVVVTGDAGTTLDITVAQMPLIINYDVTFENENNDKIRLVDTAENLSKLLEGQVKTFKAAGGGEIDVTDGGRQRHHHLERQPGQDHRLAGNHLRVWRYRQDQCGGIGDHHGELERHDGR